MVQALGLLAALAVSGAPAHQTMNLELGISDRNGICGVELPTEDGLKLEFSVRADNGNVNVALHNVEGAIVDAGLDSGAQPVMTLTFDDGQVLTPDMTAYRAGFTYRIQGAWNDPAGGRSALAALRTARAVTVGVDGRDYGPISAQTRGLAWRMLAACLARNGGRMPA